MYVNYTMLRKIGNPPTTALVALPASTLNSSRCFEKEPSQVPMMKTSRREPSPVGPLCRTAPWTPGAKVSGAENPNLEVHG